MTDSGEKRLMRMDDIRKFSMGTLKWVQENVRQILDQDLRKLTIIEDDDQRIWLIRIYLITF